MNPDSARLDDALALGWHAADLAGWAVTLAGREHPGAEAALTVADALTQTAASLTALATALVDRRPAARRPHRPGDPS